MCSMIPNFKKQEIQKGSGLTFGEARHLCRKTVEGGLENKVLG